MQCICNCATCLILKILRRQYDIMPPPPPPLSLSSKRGTIVLPGCGCCPASHSAEDACSVLLCRRENLDTGARGRRQCSSAGGCLQCGQSVVPRPVVSYITDSANSVSFCTTATHAFSFSFYLSLYRTGYCIKSEEAVLSTFCHPMWSFFGNI